MKKLSNLNWTPAWTSLVGCIHGCLKHLGIDPGFSWLYGGTGHAFIINMSQDGSCPSRPTAWNTSRFYELGPTWASGSRESLPRNASLISQTNRPPPNPISRLPISSSRSQRSFPFLKIIILELWGRTLGAGKPPIICELARMPSPMVWVS